jgi:phosphoglycerate kinase
VFSVAISVAPREKSLLKQGRLNPIVKPLEALLGCSVLKMDGALVRKWKRPLKLTTGSGKVMLLENTRFMPVKPRTIRASRGLGKLADYFVMDRVRPSLRTLVPRVCGHVKLNAAGFLMEKELKYLIGAVGAQRPMMAIVGGTKVSTRFPSLNRCSTSATSF